jgi:hypothetical protein
MQTAGSGHAQQLFNWASRSSASWVRTRGVSWTGCGCRGVRPAPAFCSRFARNGTSSSGTSFIQAGAGNPSGVARTLARAVNACHQETVRAREDPAVRLIVPQLAVLCGSLRDRQHAGCLREAERPVQSEGRSHKNHSRGSQRKHTECGVKTGASEKIVPNKSTTLNFEFDRSNARSSLALTFITF